MGWVRSGTFVRDVEVLLCPFPLGNCKSCPAKCKMQIQFKVQALISQWVQRYFLSPGPWSTLMSYWFHSLFRSSPFEIFSCPFAFAPERLPLFYKALLLAWRSLKGAFCVSRASLVIGAFSSLEVSPLSDVSAKSCYLFLLSKHYTSPHCMSKFRPQFGPLYWSSTWQSLSFFSLDRPVIDVAWKIAHGVLYTAIALFPLVTMSLRSASVALLQRLSNICFLHASWHKVSYRGYSPSWLMLPPCVRLSFVVMSSLVLLPTNSTVFLRFLSTSLMSVNSTFGAPAMISVFVMFHQVRSISLRVFVPASGFTFPCFFVVSTLSVVVVISFVNGVPGVSLPRSSKTVYSFTSDLLK